MKDLKQEKVTAKKYTLLIASHQYRGSFPNQGNQGNFKGSQVPPTSWVVKKPL